MNPNGQPSSLLVVGYGNTLRSDDGVGPRVAEAIAELALPGVQTLSCTLLTPELAEPLSRFTRVVFIDAAVDGGKSIELRRLEPAESSQITGHAAAPGTLLALARDVFGRSPEAWLLAIPVADMTLGDSLSGVAQRGFKDALKEVRRLASS